MGWRLADCPENEGAGCSGGRCCPGCSLVAREAGCLPSGFVGVACAERCPSAPQSWARVYSMAARSRPYRPVLENWTRPLGRVAANKSDRLQVPSIVVVLVPVIGKMLRHLIWWFRRQPRGKSVSRVRIAFSYDFIWSQQELDLEYGDCTILDLNWILVAISDVMSGSSCR